MKITILIVIFVFLFIETTISETTTAKNVEKRHKTKKSEKSTEEPTTEISTTKKSKSTQRPKTKPTKATINADQDDEKTKRATSNEEVAIIKPPPDEPEQSVVSTTKAPAPSTTKMYEEIVPKVEELVANLDSGCDLSKMKDCNETSSTNSTLQESDEANQIVIAEIEVKDSNTTLKVTMPDTRTKTGKSHNVTTTEKSVEESPRYVVEETKTTENMEVDDLNSGTKKGDAKKKNKTGTRKSPSKRRITKRKNHTKRRAKKDKKTKKGKTSFDPVGATDTN